MDIRPKCPRCGVRFMAEQHASGCPYRVEFNPQTLAASLDDDLLKAIRSVWEARESDSCAWNLIAERLAFAQVRVPA